MSPKTELSSFRIIETIQESKRFLVHKAESLIDHKLVLIKTAVPAAAQDPILLQSLKSEAAAGTKLRHPAIRAGLNLLEDAGQVFMIAEFAEGISLGRYLLSHPAGMPFELGLSWAKNIAEALAYAQRKGVNHLNLNPYNIIVSPANHLQVIGFGKERKAWKHSEGNFKFHFPIVYTPVEEFKGSLIHPNSDLYSWAVVVYQILTGTIPWRVDSFMSPEEQKEQCLTRAVQQPDAFKIPDWLYSIILDCLKLNPAERIQYPAILLEALKAEGKYVDYTELEELAEQAREQAELQEELDAQAAPEPEPEAQVTEPESDLPEAEIAEEQEPELTEIESFAKPELQTAETETELGDTEQSELSENETPEQSELELDTLTPEPIEHEDIADTPPHPVDEPPVEEELPQIQSSLLCEEPPPDSADVDQQETPVEIPEPEEEELKASEPAVSEPETEQEEPEAQEDQAPEQAREAEEDLDPVPARLTAKDTIPQPKPTVPTQQADEAPIVNYVPLRAPTEDLSGMQKTFKIIMFASLAIVLFLAGRYFLSARPAGLELSEKSTEPIEEPSEVSFLKDNIPIDMIRVVADTLVMGNISPEADDDEFPLLTLQLKSFLISPTEVTQEQWMMVYPQNPSQFRGDQLPVENVSFYDVIDYCNAKSIKDGLTPAYDILGSEIICDFDADGYRLPTEAEWELAAKGGMGKGYVLYSGSVIAEDVAWYNANSSARTRNVGSKQANELGLYDFSGNVFEWVWNWYAPYTYRVANLYTGPHTGTDKVIRGGSWYHGKHELRVSNREYMKPFAKNGYTGFRLVRSR
jgi:formylglycine-generating enzyme required for sulfatase activity/serine/threonine protein kinase